MNIYNINKYMYIGLCGMPIVHMDVYDIMVVSREPTRAERTTIWTIGTLQKG